MTPMKLNVLVAGFPYGGTGGTAQEVPAVGNWKIQTVRASMRDERIGWLKFMDFSDTPITMTRNAAVVQARQVGADVLVMIDSDMHPDLYLGDQGVKSFFESSFDHIHSQRLADRPSVVAAPYCGPPPEELVYVFQWSCRESDNPNPDCELKMFGREEAARLCGIGEVAALPTGLCMFDMQVFEITDPVHEFKALMANGVPREDAQSLTKPWFYYEYTSIYQAAKGSTEDVTAMRDLGLVIQDQRGYNPLFCNWDAWAGHYKPKCVGKPQPIFTDNVNHKYKTGVLSGRNSGEKLMWVNPDGNNLTG